MKKSQPVGRTLFVAVIVVLNFVQCSTKKSREEILIGEWNAQWITELEDSLMDISEDGLTMNGKITFMSDGKAEISAYGFKGCIFSDDTLTSVISWKLDENTLRFIDEGDDQGLPYNIKKLTEEELDLTLLEDIQLKLTRN